MTGPEDVYLFNKLALVCTVEGGITCHAAIMCRQMGIPAIVGIGDEYMVADGLLVEDTREPNFEWSGSIATWDEEGNIVFVDGNSGEFTGATKTRITYDFSGVPE